MACRLKYHIAFQSIFFAEVLWVSANAQMDGFRSEKYVNSILSYGCGRR